MLLSGEDNPTTLNVLPGSYPAALVLLVAMIFAVTTGGPASHPRDCGPAKLPLTVNPFTASTLGRPRADV